MLPSSDDPIWRKIILDEKQYDFDFFAMKILMGRIKMKMEFEKRENLLQECVDELVKFANQYPEHVEKELKKIKR